jgi:YidC/Oxa1 family membrane protein insertase
VNKKDTTLGVLFILAAFFCIWLSAKNSRRVIPADEVRQAVATAEQSSAPKSPGVVAAPPVPTSSESPAAFAAAAPEHAGVTITTLENDFVRFDFTDFGGAIRDASLKKYKAGLQNPDPFVINKLHANPMLAFVGLPGLDRSTRFQLVSQSPTEVVYRAALAGKFEVTRRYVLSPDSSDTTDPYQLRVLTTFRNLTDKALDPIRLGWALGTVAPASLLDLGQDLASCYSDGKDQTFILRAKLESSGGFFGLNAHDATPAIVSETPIAWAAVKSQFFSTILTPDEPGVGLVTSRVKLFSDLPDDARNAYGITAVTELAVPALAPQGTATLGASFYAGPNEYHRLSNPDVFKASQNKILDFGFFKFFSEILLTLMTWVHSHVPNWGLAIVLTTLLLRTIMMAFTIPASRSARRMQKIQPELKALREKYKDNPQKQQTATMEVFKKHKINPVGGCLPMLLTLPFFWGFYGMLRKTPELRFAPFLWAKDLSAPDTVFTFGHGHIPILGSLDLNILPILLCIVTFLQMRVTPQPTVDNAQAKMMKFTPIFFMAICYSYSCALALYSTTNGLFMIGQQMLVNRMKDDGDPTHAPGAAEKPGGKPIKNVTPPKKK